MSSLGDERVAAAAVLVRLSTVIDAELDDEIILYDKRTGSFHILNATAAVVWSLLDGSATLDEIGSTLAVAYGHDRELVTNDVVAIGSQFIAAGTATA